MCNGSREKDREKEREKEREEREKEREKEREREGERVLSFAFICRQDVMLLVCCWIVEPS